MALIQDLLHRMRPRDRIHFPADGIDPAAIDTARETLVRYISHDVNNVWARIIGYANQVGQEPVHGDRHGAVEHIEVNSRRGLLMFRAVIEILRRNEMSGESIDIASLLQDWEGTLSLLPKNELGSKFVYPGTVMRIDANRNWIDLVILACVSSIMMMAPHDRWIMFGAHTRRPQGNPPSQHRQFEITITHSLPLPVDGERIPYGERTSDLNLIEASSTLVKGMGGSMERKILMGCVACIRLQFPESIRSGAKESL